MEVEGCRVEGVPVGMEVEGLRVEGVGVGMEVEGLRVEGVPVGMEVEGFKVDERAEGKAEGAPDDEATESLDGAVVGASVDELRYANHCDLALSP